MYKAALFVVLSLLFSVAPIYAEDCDITGNVPSNIRRIICQVATSVDGGDEPVNRLTLMLKRGPANEVSSKSMDAKTRISILALARSQYTPPLPRRPRLFVLNPAHHLRR